MHVNRSRGILCLDDVAIEVEGLVGITINIQTCNVTCAINEPVLSQYVRVNTINII